MNQLTRPDSAVTLTDMFCGCGGSTTGAKRAGVEVRLALNHWRLAIESHNTNHPETDHDCADISETNPLRYAPTTGLIASPECTNHSLAKGQRRTRLEQQDFFQQRAVDPAAVRSRATMWDVVRFAEAHGYEFVITENVVDVRRWSLFDPWLRAMHALGYRHRCVYLNGMFAHKGPGSASFTPQSRDRIYIVFWKRGNRAPDLEIEPRAWCMSCSAEVGALQSWKPARSWGKYRAQYVYRCPRCAEELLPYYFAALNAIDPTLPAVRIGDREAMGKQPLKPKTLARIRYGLDRYGLRPLIVQTRYTSGIECRVRPGTDPMPTHVGGDFAALVHPGVLGGLAPFLVETAFSHAPEDRARSGIDALPAQTGRASMAVVGPALQMANRESSPPRGLDGPLHAQLTGTSGSFVVQDAPMLVPLRENGQARELVGALQALCAGGSHHMLVGPAALLTMRGTRHMGGLDEGLPTQVAASVQNWVISGAPFLTPYYGQQASPADEAAPTMTAGDRVAVVTPSAPPAVEDCYFRMLQPHEMQRGQGFPDDYVVLGTKRDRVKQIGNANPPPTMELLVERCVASLQ